MLGGDVRRVQIRMTEVRFNVLAWGPAAAARAAAIIENIRGGLGALVRRPKYAPPPAGEGPAAPFVSAWRRLRFQAVLAVAAVALAMLLLDDPLHHIAAGLPEWVVDDAFVVTDFGRSGWILVPAGVPLVLMALLASPALDHMSRAVLAMVAVRLGFVFVAVGLPGLVGTIVKRWIGRVRPSEAGAFAYEPFSWRPEYASFPSGHSTTAFAALVAIGVIVPRLRPALWIYALAIAASRVVVSAHYPSDVIAGAAFGAFGAILVRDWFAARRLGFCIGRDGAVHTMPGPSLRRIKRVAARLIAT
jgi:undecaprenyl-diphosphatase